VRNLQEQVKKIIKFYDLSLFEEIVLVISKILQILSLQPQISKVFLTVDQKNFGNKIPIIVAEE
jgi:hypothetical protein